MVHARVVIFFKFFSFKWVSEKGFTHLRLGLHSIPPWLRNKKSSTDNLVTRGYILAIYTETRNAFGVHVEYRKHQGHI